MNEAIAIQALTDCGAIAAALHTEHQAINGGIATLAGAVLAGAKPDILIKILSMVEGFCEEHFAHEEQMFRDSGYADLEAHLTAHQEMLGAIHASRVALSEGRLEATLDVSDLLNVFHDHITHADGPAHAHVLQQHVTSRGGTFQDLAELELLIGRSL